MQCNGKRNGLRDNCANMKANPLPFTLLSNDSTIYSDCISFTHSNTSHQRFVNSSSLFIVNTGNRD